MSVCLRFISMLNSHVSSPNLQMFHFFFKKWFVLAVSPDFSSLIENSCDIFFEAGCLCFLVFF